MAKTYYSVEVLELLENKELLENEVEQRISVVDLDAESEYGKTPEGDGVDADGSTMLVPNKYPSVDLSTVVGNSSPAERDSLLLDDVQ